MPNWYFLLASAFWIQWHTQRTMGVPQKQPADTTDGRWTHHGRRDPRQNHRGSMEELRKHHGTPIEAPGIIMEAPWKLKVFVKAPWRHHGSTTDVHESASMVNQCCSHRFHRASMALSWHFPATFRGDSGASEESSRTFRDAAVLRLRCLHGASPRNPCLRGVSMGTSVLLPWCFRGASVGLPWDSRGDSMVLALSFSKETRDTSMGTSALLPWRFPGTCGTSHGGSYGACVALPWCFYGTSVRPPWYFYCASMVLPWPTVLVYTYVPPSTLNVSVSTHRKSK